MDWHCKNENEILKQLNVTTKKGLNSNEVSKRRAKYGENVIVGKKPKSFIVKFFSQFADFMVIILLCAAVVSFITGYIDGSGEIVDPIIILAIVVMNAVIGVVQENKAEKAINALKKLSAPTSKVLRGGKLVSIPSQEIVPGDVITLNAGDLVPADARLIECYDLKTDEAALTGESLPSEKSASVICKKDAPLGERKNMVFSASVVTYGRAIAVVAETGMNTEVGKIANMINEEDSQQTPLQNKLEQIGKFLGIGALAICVLIFILGLIQKIPAMDIFMVSVSLAVAAIPEGLPAIVTIVLAIGVQRMVKKNAIIRKLPAVETLGSATVICSDKTGTLTQNKMTVKQIATSSKSVSLSSPEARGILTLCSMCNNSVMKGKVAQGFPTESALIVCAEENGIIKNKIDFDYKRVKEIPFSSERKIMTTVHKISNGKYRVVVKGAVDVLISKTVLCKEDGIEIALTNEKRKNIENINSEMAEKQMRVLAVAYKDVSEIPSNNNLETNLVFAGLIGMIDPPRPHVKEAVSMCKKAGIKPVMITGDHVLTACAIAKELGILKNPNEAITGAKLNQIPIENLPQVINKYSVFARVTPEHKVRIVKAFQKSGEVVAMTGDGVNDAPALKCADIGCAMGQGGTEVAKAAADMILTDDNFSTIVGAIKEGRGIYENIKKAAHFLISSNIGEIITILTASILSLPTPLLPIQLLWINLVTDSLPAMALGVENTADDVMKRKPVSPKEHLFSNGRGYEILIEGMLIGALALLAFTIGRSFFDVAVARTMTFAVLSLSQLVHAFNMRSEQSLFKIGFLSNKKMVLSFVICLALQISVITYEPLSEIFKTQSLNTNQWLIVSALSIVPFIALELEKLIRKLSKRTNQI